MPRVPRRDAPASGPFPWEAVRLHRTTIETRQRKEFVDITEDVESARSALAVTDGALVVHVPHTTAAVTINEGCDPDVAADIIAALEAMVPRIRFSHGEGNSDAHLQTLLTGSSLLVPVAGGRLALGRWQRIFLCEFDGPRRREVWVQPLQGPSTTDLGRGTDHE